MQSGTLVPVLGQQGTPGMEEVVVGDSLAFEYLPFLLALLDDLLRLLPEGLLIQTVVDDEVLLDRDALGRTGHFGHLSYSLTQLVLYTLFLSRGVLGILSFEDMLAVHLFCYIGIPV